MSGYYGMTMGGTNRTVLCHRITVQTYRRTLPNGKVVTVQGYSRQGDPLKENARSAVNRNFNDAANRAIKSSSSQARWNMRDAGNSARAAANSKDWSQRQLHATNALTSASNAVGTMAKGYANAASTKAQQLAFNARNTWRDAKETMSAAWNTFKEEAKYAGSYVKACIDVGINWVKKLVGNLFGGNNKSSNPSLRVNAAGKVTNKGVIKDRNASQSRLQKARSGASASRGF